MPDTQKLVPEWTAEDFKSEKPYEWLYALMKQNKFIFAQALDVTLDKAKSLGWAPAKIRTYWKSYLEMVTPKTRVLGANVTEFPDQPICLQCGPYVCDDSGIMKRGPMGEEIRVITHPIMPVRRVVDMETGEQKIEIAYMRSGKWETVIVPRETAASAQRIVALSRNGLAVTSENARDVVKYIYEVESMNYDELAVKRSTSRLGWLADGQFAPYAESVTFDGDSEEFDKLYADFHEEGDKDTWFNLARAVRKGRSVPARIALAAAFAAPLIKPLGALSFFVHFWGLQGSGKTVALMLAASVWGNPSVGRYIKSFSGTKVSQELFAAFCGNVPVFLDELQVIADRQSFDDIIYALCEGVSKGRGAKGGGLQNQKQWLTCFLTTGEAPIIKNNSGGGAAVRTIEINFEGTPFFDDARYVANTVKENYGFAGKMLIDALAEPSTVAEMKQIQSAFYKSLSYGIQDKQVLSASILLTADALAEKYIFHDGMALTEDDIRPFLITAEDADANRRCYNWLVGFLSANPSRFEEGNAGELWGKREGQTVYIIRSIFDRILDQNGFSAKAFLTWAKNNRKIECESFDIKNNRLTKRIMLNGIRVPCVSLKLEDTEDQQFVETDEPLPF